MEVELVRSKEDLLKEGYVYSQNLTSLAARMFIGERISADLINKIIYTIKSKNYARSSDEIRLGYDIREEDSFVSYSVFIKGISTNNNSNIDDDFKDINPFVKRVIEERNLLLEKLEKLISFLEGDNPIFKVLETIDKELLIEQYSFMLNYYIILEKRLDRLDFSLREKLTVPNTDLMYNKYLSIKKLEIDCLN